MRPRLIFFLFVSSTLLISSPFSAAEDEYYSIQIASHGNLESAQRQFGILKKRLPDDALTYLRVEKIGDLFSVRLGRYNDKESAVSLLKRLKPQLPGAFILKVPLRDANIMAIYGEDRSIELRPLPETPPGSSSSGVSGVTGPSVPQGREKTPAPRGTKEGKPSEPSKKENGTEGDKSSVFSRSVIKGTVLGSKIAPSGFACSWAKGTLYLIVVYVEEIEDVANYKNFLRDKKDRSMSFFTAVAEPEALSGKRIKALVEYRGDERCRLYWTENIEILP